MGFVTYSVLLSKDSAGLHWDQKEAKLFLTEEMVYWLKFYVRKGMGYDNDWNNGGRTFTPVDDIRLLGMKFMFLDKAEALLFKLTWCY